MEWCLLKDGVKSGRKIFLKIKDLEPPCKELYKDMIKAEILCCEDRSKRMTHIRSLYNEACHKFGIKDIGEHLFITIIKLLLKLNLSIS